jgi:hypothetical protein
VVRSRISISTSSLSMAISCWFICILFSLV